jgi:hypothetical protein
MRPHVEAIAAFISIWLGDPPNSKIKAGLLGGACG